MADWNFIIFQKINGLAGISPFLDGVGIFFAQYLPYVILAVLLLLFLFKKEQRKAITLAFLAGVVARFFVVEIVRFLFPKERPFVENDVNLLIEKVNQLSFPSGHAAFFFALSTAFYFYNRKAGIVLFVLSAFISLARVFVGVHWPLDILAGMVVGVGVGVLVVYFFKNIIKN